MKKIIVIVFFLGTGFLIVKKLLKPAPFQEEVNTFIAKDQLQKPPQNAILFVGSSSITNWKNIHKDFSAYSIIQRGIGSASFPDIIRFAGDIIYPYKPKQVLIYCGDNDFAYYENITPQKVAERFEKLFTLIRRELPATNITYISIKPSPHRWKLEQSFIEANRLIKIFLEAQSNTGYVNIHDAMLGSDGKPEAAFFVSDSLHMNEKGYQLWANRIEPYLMK